MSKRNKNSNNNTADKLLKNSCDGKQKFVNPLTKIPESKMRLYGYSDTIKNIYFNTEKELVEYINTQKNTFGIIEIFDYLGEFAGCNDVIRITDKNGKENYYTAVNKLEYSKYNCEKSTYNNQFIWEHQYGDMEEIYQQFKDRGIIFKRDVYARSNEPESVFAVPYNKAFVVKSSAKFLNEQPDFEIIEQNNQSAKKLKKQIRKTK